MKINFIWRNTITKKEKVNKYKTKLLKNTLFFLLGVNVTCMLSRDENVLFESDELEILASLVILFRLHVIQVQRLS